MHFGRFSRQSIACCQKKVKWYDFAAFISVFAMVQDSRASGRHRYGDPRLTQLNLWTKAFLRRFIFQKVHGQYDAYFSRFYARIFAYFSIVLNALKLLIVERLL
jgi:hypothetical protein